jgi:hypothetical protein
MKTKLFRNIAAAMLLVLLSCSEGEKAVQSASAIPPRGQEQTPKPEQDIFTGTYRAKATVITAQGMESCPDLAFEVTKSAGKYLLTGTIPSSRGDVIVELPLGQTQYVHIEGVSEFCMFSIPQATLKCGASNITFAGSGRVPDLEARQWDGMLEVVEGSQVKLITFGIGELPPGGMEIEVM